eukprot:NODE_10288_length_600_cov_63.035639_g10014_i0.p2 GENE.NODE_10288_length_600_cov_63.035639_g10014_i0~~NODE_10288_length_600_cov_63.035639_g10014_i0.p2  ORF type:complete len:149 (+),score=22.66 NODE_10288_length_600_cov_63.035639_g10014_i0:68-514(+)
MEQQAIRLWRVVSSMLDAFSSQNYASILPEEQDMGPSAVRLEVSTAVPNADDLLAPQDTLSQAVKNTRQKSEVELTREDRKALRRAAKAKGAAASKHVADKMEAKRKRAAVGPDGEPVEYAPNPKTRRRTKFRAEHTAAREAKAKASA